MNHYEDSGVLGCDAVLLHKWFLMFQRIAASSSSRVKSPRRMHCLTPEINMLCLFITLQCHILYAHAR
jgi:hypothetical protein